MKKEDEVSVIEISRDVGDPLYQDLACYTQKRGKEIYQYEIREEDEESCSPGRINPDDTPLADSFEFD